MFDLNYKKISVENNGQPQISQTLIESDVITPDMKPDIESVLKVSGQIAPTEEKILDGRVSFKGVLRLNILYRAKRAEKPVYSIDAEIPFEDFITLNGATRDGEAKLSYALTSLESKLINDRKISARAIITVSGKNISYCDAQIVTGINAGDDAQIKTGKIKLNETVCSVKDRFGVKDELRLPSGKPSIANILRFDADITEREVRAANGALNVKGVIRASVLYTGVTDESFAEAFEADIPFSGSLECRNCQEGMLADVKLFTDGKNATIELDADGEERNFGVEISVGVEGKIRSCAETEIIADAYGLSQPLEITKTIVNHPQYCEKAFAEFVVKDMLTLENGSPEMLKIEKVWAEVDVTDWEINADRLLVEGVVNADALYVASSDSRPVNIARLTIPFSKEIEVKGITDDMKADITAYAQDVTFNTLSPSEAEIRVTLGFEAIAEKTAKSEAITDLRYSQEQPPRQSAAVIYSAQKGDSLWDIAKKYGTTVQSLLETNEIENPDTIYPGEKLLIIKAMPLSAGQ